MPETTREKLRIALTGKKQSSTTIAKRIASLTGQKRTPEQRANIAASIKGRIATAVARNNMSIAGKKRMLISEVTRAKLREKQKLRRIREKISKTLS